MKLKAYHIDRKDSLKENEIIQLQKFTDIEPAFLNTILTNEFPDGLTKHGDLYFASALIENKIIHNGMIEIFFEHQRRLKFPNRFSRFQSFFTTETIEESLLWKEHLGLKDATIWEVEFDHNNFIKVDGSWLILGVEGVSFLYATTFAENYWNQVIHSNSLPELLIKPPVTIVRKVI